MKKSLLGVAVCLLISLPVLAALKVGDMAPDFSARGSLAGKEFNFSLEAALKKGAGSVAVDVEATRSAAPPSR